MSFLLKTPTNLDDQVFLDSNVQVFAVGQPLKVFTEVNAAAEKALEDLFDVVSRVPVKNQ